jgi:hypothetical protein
LDSEDKLVEDTLLGEDQFEVLKLVQSRAELVSKFDSVVAVGTSQLKEISSRGAGLVEALFLVSS